MNIYTYFFFTYSLIFLLISFSLILNQKLINYKIYGVLCLFMAYSSFLNFLIFSNTLVNFPFLYRTSSPVHYLYGPLNYFFILYTLDNKRIFSKRDFFHLLPFIVNFIELCPTFFCSIEHKVELLRAFNESTFMDSSLGYLNTRQHVLLKNTIYLVYCFSCLRLLLSVFDEENKVLFLKNRLLFSWLIFDTYAKLVFIVIALLLVSLSSYLPFFLRDVSNLFFGLEMLVSIIYLFFNPRLMLGVQWVGVKEIDNLISLDTKKSNRKKKKEQLILEQLTQFMDVNKPYRNKVSINDIAIYMKISSAKLASIINENYNQSFTDYINTYRLKSIDYQVSEKKHLKYSFEHIAYDAGFSSKNAFYVAFKKLRNTTPKKFYNIND